MTDERRAWGYCFDKPHVYPRGELGWRAVMQIPGRGDFFADGAKPDAALRALLGSVVVRNRMAERRATAWIESQPFQSSQPIAWHLGGYPIVTRLDRALQQRQRADMPPFADAKSRRMRRFLDNLQLRPHD